MISGGFTLPEIIIASAISAVIGGLLLGIAVNSTGVFYKQSSIVSEGLSINDSLSKIKTAIKDSQTVSAGYPEGSPPTYSSSSTALVLKIPTIDSSGNVVANTFDYAVFLNDQGKLRYKFFPNAQSSRKLIDQILSNNVASLLFQYFDASGAEIIPTSAVKVKVTVTLKQKAGASFETNTLTSEANLRND